MTYFFLCIANVIMWIIAMLLAPILPAFATSENKLPKWLYWFDTYDNPLDGDEGFIISHAPFTGTQTGWKRYINRIFWLWRNPAYGFDEQVLGRIINLPVEVTGDLRTSDHGFPGTRRCRSGDLWEFYYVRRWGTSGKCIRVRTGWKLHGCFTGDRASFVFSPKPYATFYTD